MPRDDSLLDSLGILQSLLKYSHCSIYKVPEVPETTIFTSNYSIYNVPEVPETTIFTSNYSSLVNIVL